MPRVCSICAHPKRQAIEEALFRNNVPFRNVSKQYQVTSSALFRHKQHAPRAEQQGSERQRLDSEQQVRTIAAVTAELPPKKQRYLEGRIAGKTRRAAALEAGYSESMADHPAKIETKDVRQAFASLIRETIPPERIAKAISEGFGAMETKFFSSEGSVTDSRDIIAWSERRAYAEMAATYGGYFVPEKGEIKLRNEIERETREGEDRVSTHHRKIRGYELHDRSGTSCSSCQRTSIPI